MGIPGDHPVPEGREFVFIFDPVGFLDSNIEDGPRLRVPLAEPIFAGALKKGAPATPDASAAAGTSNAPPPGASAFSLGPGDYFFMQWRCPEGGKACDGMEEFVRQLWWEGAAAEGPWLLRAVGEDGKVAWQGLRACPKDQASSSTP